jgi:hypothetical protein
MVFNEKNLQELVSLRPNEADISFKFKDVRSEKAVEVKKESNINKKLKLFLKPIDYLFKA